MKKTHKKILLLIFTLLFFMTACSTNDSTDSPKDSNKPQIVTSIFPVYEIVKEIAGNQADVTLMVGSNEDAHHYEPSAQAIAMVSEADAFIYSSDEMEFWAESMLAVVDNDPLHIVELAEDLNLTLPDADSPEDEHADETKSEDNHDHGGIDPHFWLDPVAVRQQIPSLVEVLTEIDPAGATIYQENGETFSATLDELDHAFKEEFDQATNRSFVVQHQAFGHLANRYDLEQVAVGGLSTEVESNPEDLIQIIDFVNENNTEVIFYQSGSASAVAETIANETDTEISMLYDLENEPQGFEADGNLYIEAMYHNLEQLKQVIH